LSKSRTKASACALLIPIAAATAIAVIFSLASHRRKAHAPGVISAGLGAIRASAAVQSKVFIIVMSVLAAFVIARYWLVNAGL